MAKTYPTYEETQAMLRAPWRPAVMAQPRRVYDVDLAPGDVVKARPYHNDPDGWVSILVTTADDRYEFTDSDDTVTYTDKRAAVDAARELRGTFTKTEALRRLRVLTKLARQADPDVARPFTMIEIGTRARPVWTATAPTVAEAFHPDDDLSDYTDFAHLPDEALVQGYVVHLYFTTTGYDGELVNTITGWMGTDDAEPQLVHVP